MQQAGTGINHGSTRALLFGARPSPLLGKADKTSRYAETCCEQQTHLHRSFLPGSPGVALPCLRVSDRR